MALQRLPTSPEPDPLLTPEPGPPLLRGLAYGVGFTALALVLRYAHHIVESLGLYPLGKISLTGPASLIIPVVLLIGYLASTTLRLPNNSERDRPGCIGGGGDGCLPTALLVCGLWMLVMALPALAILWTRDAHNYKRLVEAVVLFGSSGFALLYIWKRDDEFPRASDKIQFFGAVVAIPFVFTQVLF
jgi:hypothetical protein